jgi:glycosyltransferase involved in cell wall biosynthesis
MVEWAALPAQGDEFVKVSALIPTYNRRAYVFRAIDSILRQTVPVGEILVVDDGSTDGTARAIEARYGQAVRVIGQAHLGASAARRRAVAEARGTWVAFLDSDDVWTPDRNRVLLDAVGKVGSDVAWIFGDIQVITDAGEGTTSYDEHGLVLKGSPHVFEDPMSVQYPFQFGMLGGSLVRRDVLLELNCFSEGLEYSEDLLAGYQVACQYKVAAIPNVTMKYYRTSDLRASSLMLRDGSRPDYYRARMLAWSLVAETGRWSPWGELHAGAVRGLCTELAKEKTSTRGLACRQFRYSFSMKSVAFCCAAMLGRKGLDAWAAGRRYRFSRG